MALLITVPKPTKWRFQFPCNNLRSLQPSEHLAFLAPLIAFGSLPLLLVGISSSLQLANSSLNTMTLMRLPPTLAAWYAFLLFFWSFQLALHHIFAYIYMPLYTFAMLALISAQIIR
jgi:hypothetical protein